ncbi:hypothetical protein BTO06_05515 [Tenacibaculum sp. SZ-18]|uniref:hypothetical protein n=1 Tax=Tenacibaculum sp. SZ-18 TaxID=754423 RepID=UPI000C2D12E5|nr:hypothetical protein [Tenacibaculum sp. SZ-18]AUC14629.1 hypothetical protein BTO06_05515 [Tenacibaculum sp. SZ-18]
MKYLFLIFLFFTLSLYSQNTIKGKLITSESFKEQFPVILVSVDGFSGKSTIDKKGLFELPIEKQQTEYLLNFFINDSLVKRYTYKNKWSQRKRPKSISFHGECSITQKMVGQDWKSDKLKLYVFQEYELSQNDLKYQKKYNFTYSLVSKKDSKNYDCYKNYNKKALKYLVLVKELSLQKLNKNTIGKNRFSITDKSCIR